MILTSRQQQEPVRLDLLEMEAAWTEERESKSSCELTGECLEMPAEHQVADADSSQTRTLQWTQTDVTQPHRFLFWFCK